MRKRLLSLLVALTMVTSLTAGCESSKEKTQESNSTATEEVKAAGETTADDSYGVIDFNEDPYTLSLPLITLGDVPTDMKMVQDAVNEYLLEKINVQVEMEAIGVSDLTNTYTLKASGNEKLDLINMLPTSTILLPMISSKMVMPIDDLLAEWGQGIIEDAGKLIECGVVSGKQYMIPCFEDARVPMCGLEFNAELVKKYDLLDEIKNIKTLADAEPLLELIKEKEPNVIPVSDPTNSSGYTVNLFGYDTLGDTLGVLEYGVGGEYDVVNWYETDTFMNHCKLIRDWFEKGYISKDTITSQESGINLLQNGKVFMLIDTYAPNQDCGLDLENPGQGGVEIPLSDTYPVISTSGISITGWAISASCERPDKAMQFLNLLYTDPTLCTLLQRGIEETHYSVTDEDLADLVQMGESGYYIVFGQFGDESLLLPRADLGADYKERLDEYVKLNTYSPAYGFIFDSSEYSTELAACNAVVNEYFKVIDCGSVDPEVEIPKFVAKLKASGLDTLIEAKQKQLDEWVALQE